ncbi:hypothetical protein IB286_02260 [Spongiibacter sp. KMU-158]|uniref:Transcriptional regulator SutA RNAP-binding domain-containing protein n=1 Tax=Spongiibacter pelagi TaxID=2760804 RepID=A0A927BZB8_9GAMM|nr:hypothetical protein [Spongiibacter pelagi]MBD2857814.1 hypothetical protein [Spongiibacter pelagi]
MGSRTRHGDQNRKGKMLTPTTPAAGQTQHDRMRDQLASDVEAFLSKGGQIQHLEPHMRGSMTDNDLDY